MGDKIHLAVRNQGGSVQHYYHFLLGFMVPLVIRLERQPPATPADFFIRSCGPMDRHLAALGYSNLKFLPPFLQKSGLHRLFMAGEKLAGYDVAGRYDQTVLRAAAGIIASRLGVKDGEKSSRPPKIVAVNRSVDRFYNTSRSEIKDSGAQRRSIPNYAVLEKHLSAVRQNFHSLVLEGATLADQIRHFQTADVIIAQHGAALANLIFARPGARVVEILPPNHPGEYFSELAKCLELDYRVYHQAGAHAEVNPREIAALLG